MRWKPFLGGLALLLAATSGCKQPILMTANPEANYSELRPPELENNYVDMTRPMIEPTRPPATVLDPDREIRKISLAECMAMALENGQIGTNNLAFLNFQAAGNLQTLFDQSVQFTGQGITGTDYIRCFRLDPAITGAGIELALSRFDAVWSSTASWNNNDTPIGTSLTTFQSGGVTSALNVNNTTTSTVNTGIFKPLPTGGVAGITFNNTYTFTNLPAKVNPAYQPVLQFQFEQPLLTGFGVEINQLRNAHPGSILNPGLFNVSPSAEGILITRTRFDQNRTEFERLVNFMALNVENAYWNLYWEYWAVYAQEQGLRQSYEAWKITKASYDAGKANSSDLATARAQYEGFRFSRLTEMGNVLEYERRLRGLIGLRVEDGYRLVPSDQPTLTQFQPDWATSLEEALNRVPDILLCRQDLKIAQMNVISLKNQLLPDLRFTATYDINALGNTLDGTGTNNAFRELGSDRFNDFSLGLRLNVPIGFRAAQSNYRIAQLRLARAYEFLKNEEWKVERTLAQNYRTIFFAYELIKIQRSAREANAEALKAKFQQYVASVAGATLATLLDSQRLWANSIRDEYDAIRQYNQAIVAFEAAKGTALYRNNIIIAEGPVPAAAAKRGFEHERQRDMALPLRDRSLPIPTVPIDQMPAPVGGSLEVHESPERTGSLLALWDKHPPLTLDVPPLPSVSSLPNRNGQSVASPGQTAGNSGGPVLPASFTMPGYSPGMSVPAGLPQAIGPASTQVLNTSSANRVGPPVQASNTTSSARVGQPIPPVNTSSATRVGPPLPPVNTNSANRVGQPLPPLNTNSANRVSPPATATTGKAPPMPTPAVSTQPSGSLTPVNLSPYNPSLKPIPADVYSNSTVSYLTAPPPLPSSIPKP